MPDLSISPLGGFANLRQQGISANTPIQLAPGRPGGQAVAAGSTRWTVSLARAWDCVFRSPQQIQQNKDNAREFLGRLENTFGKDIANALSGQLAGHLNKGRPLSAGRISSMVYEGLRMAQGKLRDNFTPDQIAFIKANRIPVGIALQYKAAGIPLNERMLPGRYISFNVEGPGRAMGGEAGDARGVNYRVPGGLAPMVYKEARAGSGVAVAGENSGIEVDDARIPARNMGTSAVARLLGFPEIVPETGIGLVGGKVGVVMAQVDGFTPTAQAEIVLGRLPDPRPAEERPAELNTVIALKEALDRAMTAEPADQDAIDDAQMMLDENMRSSGLRLEDDGRVVKTGPTTIMLPLENPNLRRDLVRLQLLDALSGQVDRHAGNYLVRLGPGGEYGGLSAIDNDQSFGKNITDPRQAAIKGGGTGYHGVGLPPVIDTDMAREIEGMEEGALGDQLRASGLSEDEITASVSRLRTMKAHVQVLRDAVPSRIIAPGDWGGAVATAALEGVGEPRFDSYVQREAGVMRDPRLPRMTLPQYQAWKAGGPPPVPPPPMAPHALPPPPEPVPHAPLAHVGDGPPDLPIMPPILPPDLPPLDPPILPPHVDTVPPLGSGVTTAPTV